jgi:peptide/nickel transport system permease protein
LADLLLPTNTVSSLTSDDAQGLSESVTPFKQALRQFRRHKIAMASLIILVILILLVVLAPFVAKYGANERVAVSGANLKAPSSKYWLGTDDIGRDMFSRIIWGGRISIAIGLAAALVSSVVGTLIGAVAGYMGGRIDDLLMRFTDVFLGMPLLVVLALVSTLVRSKKGTKGGPSVVPIWAHILGPPGSLRLVITILSLIGWMIVARLVRGSVLSLKEKEFVEASKALGASTPRILFSHLIPNSIGPIIVSATFAVAGAIAAESTLSFFGFGVDPSKGSWGALLTDSKGYIVQNKWWMVIFPSVALLITVLVVNFIGDGLRDAFDPKGSKGRA